MRRGDNAGEVFHFQFMQCLHALFGEGDDSGGGQINACCRQGADQDVEVENGIAISSARVLALDQGGAEAAFCEHGGDRHENRQHGDQAELLRQKQPRQNHRGDKSQTLVADELNSPPLHGR